MAMSIPKPKTYLSSARECLFYTLNMKDDGSLILSATRQKNSVLLFTENDVSLLAASNFLYNIAQALIKKEMPVRYEKELKFDEDYEDIGGKRLLVSFCLFQDLSIGCFILLSKNNICTGLL